MREREISKIYRYKMSAQYCSCFYILSSLVAALLAGFFLIRNK